MRLKLQLTTSTEASGRERRSASSRSNETPSRPPKRAWARSTIAGAKSTPRARPGARRSARATVVSPGPQPTVQPLASRGRVEEVEAGRGEGGGASRPHPLVDIGDASPGGPEAGFLGGLVHHGRPYRGRALRSPACATT